MSQPEFLTCSRPLMRPRPCRNFEYLRRRRHPGRRDGGASPIFGVRRLDRRGRIYAALSQKWADEAQAWLIDRDLDLKTIWFHELRYEGSPGLWHTILWVAQHVFHARYDGLGYIGMAGGRHGRSRAADFQSPVSAIPSLAPRLHIRGCTLCHASRWGHSLEASHGSENNVTPLWGAGSSPDYGAAVSLAEESHFVDVNSSPQPYASAR